MRTLPRTIVLLNDRFRSSDRFERVAAGSGVLRTLLEKDYDALIRDNASVIAELLVDAGVLADGSQLRYLGSQVSGIDVLFAEVSPAGAFRRFVLVEDKLLRNPEAKRTVLAQILDYAHKLQYDLTVDQLVGDLQDHEWIEENRDDIEASVRTGDCLLLICGDEVHVRVATLAERFAKQANPLSRCALAMVSLNVYSNGKQQLLVPAIVEAVTDIQRELTIRVKVVDAKGRTVPSQEIVADDEEVRAERPSSTEAEWLVDRWAKFSAADREACQAVFRALEEAAIPGTRKELLASGRPQFVVGETPWGRVKLLRAAYTVPAIRTMPDSHGAMKKDRQGAEFWEAYHKALLHVKGAVLKGDKIHLPVRELWEDRCRELIQVLTRVCAVLRQTAPEPVVERQGPREADASDPS